MCQLTIRIELEQLKWSVASLAAMCGTPGSYEKENAENIARGIKSRLDWCLLIIETEPELIGAKGPTPLVMARMASRAEEVSQLLRNWGAGPNLAQIKRVEEILHEITIIHPV